MSTPKNVKLYNTLPASKEMHETFVLLKKSKNHLHCLHLPQVLQRTQYKLFDWVADIQRNQCEGVK